ncbi:phosphotransferase [Isoptericola variabilis]|uniref:phosphotransferase n=1 Tax=Isoptericola variabilis TaxID=139208 RepID=UPI001E3AF10A|nr:phosphotransferase [Isoptericola variabilis]
MPSAAPYALAVEKEQRWLPGTPADRAAISDPDRFARDLGLFLLALHRVETEDGPRPGLHNWYRADR